MVDPLVPVTLRGILRHCPNIEVLAKYEDDLLPHDLTGADLTRLKRLEWWHSWNRDGYHQFDTEGDDKSLGVDFLNHVVHHSPNLQYLSLSRRHRMPHTRRPRPPTVLPALETLRVDFASSAFRAEIEAWVFPALRHIVTDSSMLFGAPSPLLKLSTVEVLELTNDDILLDAEYLPPILHACPRLRKLNFYVQFTHPSQAPVTPHHALRCVGLSNKVNPMLIPPLKDAELMHWHFAMLKRASFPALERVVLHGDWGKLGGHQWFPGIAETLRKEDIHIEFELDR